MNSYMALTVPFLTFRSLTRVSHKLYRYAVAVMIIAVKPPLIGPSYQSFMEAKRGILA